MAIQLGEVISRFIPGSKREIFPPVPKPNLVAIFNGHRRLFDHYGISLEALKEPGSDGEIITVPTEDGPVCIRLRERTIVAPPIYYLH